MVNNRNYANQHNNHVLLAARVDTKRLSNCGIIDYRTDLLGKRTRYQITLFSNREIN
jgi:hypothetical protein